MRVFFLVLAVSMLAIALTPAREALAASAGTERAETTIALQQEVDDNDDTRVEVQLLVLGVAAFLVVGVGAAAYLVRKRLGLVPPPPGTDVGGHH